MTRKVYVVNERSFEYNDEIYHLPNSHYGGIDDESGIPHKVFSKLEDALELCRRENLLWLKNTVGCLANYTYSMDDIFVSNFDWEEFFEVNGMDKDEGDLSKLESNQLKELVEKITIVPWIVCEVEIAE